MELSATQAPAKARFTARGAFVLACWMAAGALLWTNVQLNRSNANLASMLDVYRRSLELQAGATVPPIVGVDLAGKRLVLDVGSLKEPRLMLVFSPTCPVCDDNWPQWSRIMQAVASEKVVAVDLSGRSDAEYFKRHGIIDAMHLAKVDPQSIIDYRFRFTPQTIVLKEGKVAGL